MLKKGMHYDWQLTFTYFEWRGSIGRTSIRWFHPLTTTVQTVAPNDAIGTRRQCLYQVYFDLIFAQKWRVADKLHKAESGDGSLLCFFLYEQHQCRLIDCFLKKKYIN